MKCSRSLWSFRFLASGLHCLLSLVVALAAAILVFGFWYPYPYREISSGRELFLLVVSVDVILGPLITLMIVNRNKSKQELCGDLLVVGLIQVAALGYGLWTVAIARPVHMVFEYDRFRVVHAIEVDPTLLRGSSARIVALPLSGPTLLALRPFRDEQEKMEATMAALQGVSLASRPELWIPYEEATAAVLKYAQPAEQLLNRFSASANDIRQTLHGVGRAPQDVVYLPLVGRKSFWTVFLDPVTAQVLVTMPLDSF